MEKYLESHCGDDILKILKAQNTKEIPFKALNIDLKVLKTENVQLFNQVNNRNNVHKMRPAWTKALNTVQEAMLKSHPDTSLMSFRTVKVNFPVTFVNHIETDVAFQPFNKLWKFIQIEGKVVRSNDWRKQEIVKDFTCRKCKKDFKIDADRILKFHFTIPSKCPKSDCKGTVYEKESFDGEVNLKNFMDFQEITIQPYNKPTTLTVELDEELIETCFVGDQVTICGTYEIRSDKGINDNHRLVMRAISVVVHKHQQKMNYDPYAMNVMIRNEWQEDLEEADNNELVVRDAMISSVAPLLDGLAIAKLGLMLTLCSGGESGADNNKTSSTSVREIVHLLLIGDPGLGKSQLLRSASEISVNSVRTVGFSTTTAGLTATCRTEKGETHLEAGALVKANNGICCIDEINLMSKEHRGCIHEVMESQTITIHKAGFSGKLSAKCNIIASMNQKNSNLAIDASNLAMEGSLISRFDLVFELLDPRNEEFDQKVFDLMLEGLSELGCSQETIKPPKWSLERLQSHILIAKNIRVELTEPAKAILQNYYVFCKNQVEIEKSRKTPRLYNSLERLTVCHAKLMLRNKTELMDAVTVVMLMESSWSFGHLMPQTSVVLSSIPLGPTNEYFVTVLEKLSLEYLLDGELEKNQPKKKSEYGKQANQSFSIDNIDDIFNDSGDFSMADLKALETKEDDHILSLQAVKKLISTEVISQTSSPFNTSAVSTFKLTDSLSEENIFDDVFTFKPKTQFTSTQYMSSDESRHDKRSSTVDLYDEEKKKMKLDEAKKIKSSDPLKDNLNTLSTLLAGNSATSSNSLPLVEQVEQNPFTKLKKFQFIEPESTTDENYSLTVQKDQQEFPSKAEQAKKTSINVEEFDIWGDFDVDV